MPEKTYDYDQINTLVLQANLDFSTSEIQGIASGMVCGGVVDIKQLWEQSLYSGVDADKETLSKVRKALEQVRLTTETEITNQSMALSLLLPNDDTNTSAQAIAIRDWCQGFLYGFGLAGPQAKELFSEDAGEALEDFAEISKLEPDLLDEEDIESALAELSEFIWVAALLIHQDVIGRRPEGQKYDH